jgi:hypothetical protein
MVKSTFFLALTFSISAFSLEVPPNIGLFCKNTANAGVADANFKLSEQAMNKWIESKKCPDYQEELPGLTWQKSIYANDFVRSCVHIRNAYYTAYTSGSDKRSFENGIRAFIKSEKLEHYNKKPESAVQNNLLKYLKFVKNNQNLFSESFGTYNNAGRPNFAKELGYRANYLSNNENDLQQANDMKAAEKLGSAVICAQYVGLFNASTCMDAVRSIKKIMSPVNNISLLSLIAEIIANPVYNDAAMDLAIMIQEKIDNDSQPKGNLFDDLKSIFKSYGETEEQAIDKSFKLIALYASNGPTTPQYISAYLSEQQVKLYVGLAAFSTGITVLNQRTYKTGHPYVLPANYQSTCDNGKPYHFWMSAFLARYSGQVVGNAKIGSAAAFISQIGYQMVSKTSGRDPLRAFATPSDSTANQKIRLDITSASLGAHFGASFVGSPSLSKDIKLSQDEALKKMLTESQSLEVLTADELTNAWTSGGGLFGYQRWQKIFAPEAVYNYVFKGQ